MEILQVDAPEACRDIWRTIVPQESLFDLWDVRECFWRHYGGQPLFLVARQSGQVSGLLALARTGESGGWGSFPGETWMGKTWLERNRIIAANREVYHALLEKCPPGTHLRYLSPNDLAEGTLTVDEIGYLFVPEQWGYSAETFWASFSGKSRKRLRREMDSLASRGMNIRRGVLEDIDIMFDLNRRSFGGRSYFADERFYQGFRDMIAWLSKQGCLGITTILIEGTVAAVDVNAVYRDVCTVLAGGTHPDFPGVAKLINSAHIEWACEQKFTEVDFLCGDFGWKQRFHLTPRPLYQYKSLPGSLGSEILEEASCVNVE